MAQMNNADHWGAFKLLARTIFMLWKPTFIPIHQQCRGPLTNPNHESKIELPKAREDLIASNASWGKVVSSVVLLR